jgi:hypothetical protein
MTAVLDGHLYELRCRAIHPLGCQARIRGEDFAALMEAAIAHGAMGHGHGPSYYDAERRSQMTRTLLAAVAARDRAPEGPRSSSPSAAEPRAGS